MNIQEKTRERGFALCEDFVIKTEQKENPRKMPYIYLSSYMRALSGPLLHIENMEKLLSSLDKKLVTIDGARKFLKQGWPRDNYLYFNSIYFPYRFIDGEGRYRPEYEAFVLNRDMKTELAFSKKSRVHNHDPVFSIGDGGAYFPDHDNNILFISDGIVIKEKQDTETELHEKIIELHKKIFGDDFTIIIMPAPENITSHIDTHLSVLPNTKTILIEHDYYDQLMYVGKIEQLLKLGYINIIKIPKTEIECPLNILYLENSEGKICAILNPKTPETVKIILAENNITLYELDSKLVDILDEKGGGIRCFTNELHTNDPTFLRKLGFKPNIESI